MKDIKVYFRPFCPYCNKAKEMLRDGGYEFEEINVTKNPEILEELVRTTGQETVPFIFVGDQLIGGSTDLEAAINDGSFAEIVNA